MDDHEYRWYVAKYSRHPPNCNCAECVKGRPVSYKEEAKLPRSILRRRTIEEEEEYRNLGRTDMRKEGALSVKNMLHCLVRIVLNLLILSGFVYLIRYAYLLFTTKADPLRGSITLIVGVAVWSVVVYLTRKYFGRVSPSMRLTFLIVVGILLTLSFSGVQPFATYKDSTITYVKDRLTAVTEVVVPTGPHGTYSQTGLGLTFTITFSGDTITLNNGLTGKEVYRYKYVLRKGDISKGLAAVYTSNPEYAIGIWLEDVATGNSHFEAFRYVRDQDCITYGSVTYYK